MHANQERQYYITNLLSETLPSSLMNESHLLKIALQEDGLFIVLQFNLSNGLKQIINSLNEFQRTEWKTHFHDQIIQCFSTTTIEPITLLNLQPFSRMLLLSLAPNIDLVTHKQHLQSCFIHLDHYLTSNYNASLCGCFGSFETHLFDIGNSYKRARKLQEFSFIIGIGHSCFFDDFSFNEDYSLIEYQYIHDFNQLLYDRSWQNLEQLFDQIKKTLIHVSTKNPKTIYIYKELYSITIRYLFAQVGSYEAIIKALNEGIIMFEHLFDDIQETHEYYRNLLYQIRETDSNMPYCLHIKKTLQVIHSDYMKSISLSDIANSLALSIAYLCRLFKEEVGINFKDYLTNYRIQVAKDLLISTKKDLSTIALNIGYPSSTQFIRIFKAHEHITPNDFRKTHNAKHP